ncbi:hypothetical protein ACLM5H_01005 [Fredinandcohnia humi]
MKIRYIVIPIMLVVFILSLTPWGLWLLKKEVSIEMTVIDKTVPQTDYREHLALFWVNKHLKLTKPDGSFYEIEKDYQGYKPGNRNTETTLTIPQNQGIIYVTDTYGVYNEDIEGNPLGKRSDLLYGGLTIFDWNNVMSAKNDNTTLILEFNTIASPTAPFVRDIVEKNMGIIWTGWIGRYFPNLNSLEVPIWLKENYEKQYGEKWEFSGKGLVFLNDNDHVIVLDKDEIKGAVEFHLTDAGLEKYPKVRNSIYGYWFDIVSPVDDSSVVEANYHVAYTNKGKKKLLELGIPTTIPAVIHHEQNRTYYFAGDFADISTNHQSHWVLPLPFYWVMGLINKDENFFWRSYIPLMEKIYEDIKRKDYD